MHPSWRHMLFDWKYIAGKRKMNKTMMQSIHYQHLSDHECKIYCLCRMILPINECYNWKFFKDSVSSWKHPMTVEKDQGACCQHSKCCESTGDSDYSLDLWATMHCCFVAGWVNVNQFHKFNCKETWERIIHHRRHDNSSGFNISHWEIELDLDTGCLVYDDPCVVWLEYFCLSTHVWTKLQHNCWMKDGQ